MVKKVYSTQQLSLVKNWGRGRREAPGAPGEAGGSVRRGVPPSGGREFAALRRATVRAGGGTPLRRGAAADGGRARPKGVAQTPGRVFASGWPPVAKVSSCAVTCAAPCTPVRGGWAGVSASLCGVVGVVGRAWRHARDSRAKARNNRFVSIFLRG